MDSYIKLIISMLIIAIVTSCGGGGSNTSEPNSILDLSFGNGKGFISIPSSQSLNIGRTIAIDGGGRILVVSSEIISDTGIDLILWRFTENGELDTSFGNGKGYITHHNAAGGNRNDGGKAIALDDNGKIVVAGFSEGAGYKAKLIVWRFTPSGDLDSSFGSSNGYVEYSHPNIQGNMYGNSITIDSSGNIFISGYGVVDLKTDLVVWKLNNSGSLDPTFGLGVGYVLYDGDNGSNIDDIGHDIALDNKGNILVTGRSGDFYDGEDIAVWRFTPNGNPDASFGNGNGFVTHHNAAGGYGADYASSLELDTDDSIFVIGASESKYNHIAARDMVIWKFTPGGELDPGFNSGKGFITHNNAAGGNGDDFGRSSAIDKNGKVLVVGHSHSNRPNNPIDLTLWRFHKSGKLDDSFGNGKGFITTNHDIEGGSSDYGLSVVIDSNGKAIVAGKSIYQGKSTLTIWRFN